MLWRNRLSLYKGYCVYLIQSYLPCWSLLSTDHFPGKAINNNMWHLYSTLFSYIAVLRRFTVLLSLTRTCSNPAHISTPEWAYSTYYHYRRKALLEHISITSCQVLIFMDEWTSCQHDRIGAPGTSNPRPYALTNCAISDVCDKILIMEFFFCCYLHHLPITLTHCPPELPCVKVISKRKERPL